MCPQNQASYLLCLVCTKFAASFLALPVRFDSFGECAARTSLCPARPGLEETTRLISPLQLSGRLLHYSGRLTFGLSDLTIHRGFSILDPVLRGKDAIPPHLMSDAASSVEVLKIDR